MTDLKPILELAKTLGSYVGVLYAFGFLVVRARLTALGVWTGLPLVDALYLSEGALFVAWTIWVLLKPIGVWVVVIAALGWFAQLALGVRVSLRVAKLQRFLPVLQVLLVVVVFVAGLLSARPAFHVGALLLSRSRPAALPSYDQLVIWTATAALTWYWLRMQPLVPALFRQLAGLLTLALIVVPLPFTYAIDRRCSEFPVAAITLEAAGEAEVTGWLIYETPDYLVVFDRAANVIQTLTRKNIKNIIVQRYEGLRE